MCRNRGAGLVAVVWPKDLQIRKTLTNLSNFPGAAASMVGNMEHPPVQEAIERYDVVRSPLRCCECSESMDATGVVPWDPYWTPRDRSHGAYCSFPARHRAETPCPVDDASSSSLSRANVLLT